MGKQLKNATAIACLKTMLFIFNLLFWLTGLLVLIMGIWIQIDLSKYMELSPEFSESLIHVIIGIAVLMVLVSSVAFYCIVEGEPVLLYLYAGFLACTIMINIGFGVSVACYKDTFPKSLHEGLTQIVVNNKLQKSNLDFAQEALHCCGVSNYTDWVRFSPQRVIPTSCCMDSNNCVTANYSDVYQRGCYDVITEYLESNMDLVVGTAIGAGLFPLCGAIISCGLASYIKKSKYGVMN